MRQTLRSEKQRPWGEIHVILVDERAMRKLNWRFLKERGSTDVIAFPYEKEGAEKRGLTMGDVYISIPDARRNAKRFQEPFLRELVRLIVHGTLHLLGYKDHPAKQRHVMWAKQEALVERLCRG